MHVPQAGSGSGTPWERSVRPCQSIVSVKVVDAVMDDVVVSVPVTVKV
jgi:hypothetical protein